VGFKTAIQRELDSFFKQLSNEDISIREATKSAFSQARAKLNPWAFSRLNEVVVNTFYQQSLCYTWHGMRTLAVDGSRLVLPKHQSVEDEFGIHEFGPKADSPRSMAISSTLYDVFNHLTLDAQLAPYSGSEIDLLDKHLEKVEKGDMLLLDRGYPSFALFFILMARGIEFTVRMKDNWWLSVKEFVASGQKEQIVSFTLPDKDREKLADYPEMIDSTIPCRLIRIELEGGEVKVLCTSLTDMEKYKHSDFKELYHYRWNTEEAYKLLKSRIELEDFSGKTARAVHQDFQAKIFLMTLTAAYAFPVEERVRKEFKAGKKTKAGKKRKYDQKINRTNAISTTINSLIGLFIKKKESSTMEEFDDNLYKTREIIRPGRSFERKHKPKKNYAMAYKRL